MHGTLLAPGQAFDRAGLDRTDHAVQPQAERSVRDVDDRHVERVQRERGLVGRGVVVGRDIDLQTVLRVVTALDAT
jgi:hypothetical protein